MRYFKLFLICIFLISNLDSFAQFNTQIQYFNPKPNSVAVSLKTNIIIKFFNKIDRATFKNDIVIVTGEESGLHEGNIILLEDNRTLIINPNNEFTAGEEVIVKLNEGLSTDNGKNISNMSYKFSTIKQPVKQYRNSVFQDEAEKINILRKGTDSNILPAPPITIDSVNNPSDGNIFLATWDRNVPAKYGNFIFLLDKDGNIEDSIRVKGAPFDFQVQQNGLLTYALGDFSINVPLPGEDLRYIVMDSTFAIVDSFKMKNGYTTDFHEFKLLPNGHAMMMSYHTIIYDMSKIVEGGRTDASLVINILQEQDRDKNVVFEWRNIDYIPITDSDLDLTSSRINYGTLNAFDIDSDGNILASFRNHSEIMKISRETGEVLWRMGGPRGEFEYTGEHEESAPYYHSRQHNIHRHSNGNITLFDNGQFHKPPYSRAVEYKIDEENKTATLISEWRYPNGNIFCVTAGNAQLLENGGWFIGYGVPNPQFVKRNAVEVHPDGSIALELSLPPGVLAYRVSKFPWKKSVNKSEFTNFEVKEGNRYSFNNEEIITGVDIKYNSLPGVDYNEAKITRLPYGPKNPEFVEENLTIFPFSLVYEGFAINTQTAEFYIDVEKFPQIKDPALITAYYREFPNQGLFIELPTQFDDSAKEIIFTVDGFGEIIFGKPKENYIVNVPILYEPENDQKLILQDSIVIRWTGKGQYNSFEFQVSSDSTFTNLLIQNNTTNSFNSITGIENNKSYFWRVRSSFDTLISDWSQTFSFHITDPYLNIVSPKGGEEFYNGNTEVVRWETNIQDNIIIELLENELLTQKIDTVNAALQAYTWMLNENITPAESYSLRIVSDSDPSLFDISDSTFSIIDTITSVHQNEQIPTDYSLSQNYPNPFNPSTTIEFSLPNHVSNVRLNIYNLLGQKIKSLVNEPMSAGTHKVEFDASELASGIYIYKLETEYYSSSKKLVLLK